MKRKNNISSLLFMPFLVWLFNSCQPYKAQSSILGRVHSVNQKKIENLKSEIGQVLIYKVIAKIQTDQGVLKKTKIVKAQVIGHEEFAGSVSKILKFENEHNDKLIFYSEENKLEIDVELGRSFSESTEFPGADLYLKNGRKKIILNSISLAGKKVHNRGIVPESYFRSVDCIQKYGFQLLDYRVVRK